MSKNLVPALVRDTLVSPALAIIDRGSGPGPNYCERWMVIVGFSFRQLAEKMEFGESATRENLTVFPIFLDQSDRAAVDYLLLDQALEANVLHITEVDTRGEVNTILVRNSGPQPVLILDGEELLGAKQNRMVNATILIPAQEKVEVPVSCVEQGRWAFASESFASSKTMGYSSLRRKKAQQVTECLAFSGDFGSDQGAIWEEIDELQASMDVHSPTDSLHNVYESRAREMTDLTRGLEAQADQTGVAAFVRNHFVCLDLFDRPETLHFLWDKLVASYALEAMVPREEKSSQSRPDPAPVKEALLRTEAVVYSSVGLGSDIRLSGSRITGAGLLLEDRLLHLGVFSTDENGPRQSRMQSPRRRRREFE